MVSASHLLLNSLHFVHVFVEDVLSYKFRTFELLPTERTKVLALVDLLRVHLDKPLHFSVTRESRKTHTHTHTPNKG